MVETRSSSRKRQDANAEEIPNEEREALTEIRENAPPKKRQKREDPNPKLSSLKKTQLSKPKNSGAASRNGMATINISAQSDCFSHLPVELHFEIASHLTIESLLRLSRVSRRLRSILLSKKARQIWVECLIRLGAPPCPNCLSEPRYASMLFESCCDICAIADETVQAHYELRIRLCSDCLLKNVQTGRFIGQNFDPNLFMIADIYTLVPHLHDDGKDISSKPIYVLQKKQYIKADFIKALEGYKAAQLINPEALAGYVREHQQRRVDFVEQCVSIRDWVFLRAEKRAQEIVRLREERWKRISDAAKKKRYTKGEIETNLIKLGWMSGELEKEEYNDEDHNHLLSELISAIKIDRKKREEEELCARTGQRVSEFASAYKQYLRNLQTTHGEHETFPIESEMLSLPQCLPSFEHDLFEHRVQLMKMHATALSQWHSESTKTIPDEDLSEQIHNQLHLATSFFSAYEYKTPYYVSPASLLCPSIIGERKISPWFAQNLNGDRPGDTRWFRFRYKAFGLQKRSQSPETTQDVFKYVNVHGAAVDMACVLLRDLRMPRLTTTMAEMLAVGERFVCQRCEDEENCGLGWLGIVEHFLQEKEWYEEARTASRRQKFGIEPVELVDDHSERGRVNAGSLLKIFTDNELKRLNNKRTSQRTNSESDIREYKCHLCITLELRPPTLTRRQVETHILKKHGTLPSDDNIYRVLTPAELTLAAYRRERSRR